MSVMTYNSSMILPFTFLFIGSLVFGHGEDKPGPHGGRISMPGSFHTEVILQKDQSLRVYLLDLHFKNPTTKNSSVQAQILNGKTKISFACVSEFDSFVCKAPKKYPLKGELQITATRENAVGNVAAYTLPL